MMTSDKSTILNNMLHDDMIDFLYFYRDLLKTYEVTDVDSGKEIAEDLLELQKELHQKMVGNENNEEWKVLSDFHYDFRQIRRRILNDTGRLAMKLKREKSNG